MNKQMRTQWLFNSWVMFDCFEFFASIGTKNFVTLILFGLFYLFWLFHFHIFIGNNAERFPVWLMVHCNINIHFYLLCASSYSASISNSYRDFYGVQFFHSYFFFCSLFIHKFEYPINFIDHHFITLHWQVFVWICQSFDTFAKVMNTFFCTIVGPRNNGIVQNKNWWNA